MSSFGDIDDDDYDYSPVKLNKVVIDMDLDDDVFLPNENHLVKFFARWAVTRILILTGSRVYNNIISRWLS